MMSFVGFLPATDERVRGTVAAIERELVRNDLVLRYSTESAQNPDGLPTGEGAFLPCTFWLADNYALQGRVGDARRLFERLLGLTNDVGLLSEEYDVEHGHMLGNSRKRSRTWGSSTRPRICRMRKTSRSSAMPLAGF